MLAKLVRRAFAALQITIAPHEIGAPVEETQTAHMIPSEPSEESQLGQARTEAARIITQLEQSGPTQIERQYPQAALTDADKAAIKAAIMAGGPPRDAIMETPDGHLLNLDGSAYKQPERVCVNTVRSSIVRRKRARAAQPADLAGNHEGPGDGSSGD